jgi:large subunit ribosomal protein L10
LAVSKEQKVKMVADYVDKISRSQAILLADYRGLTVADTLFARALDEAGIPVSIENLEGPIAAGYCLGDAPPAAKALMDFAKERQLPDIKGAILGTRLVGADAVKDLANLPPREILLAQLLGAVQGPMSGLVSTINAPMRELAQVLHARSEQGQEAAA